MDYTDGYFHSDYLMQLRAHGMKITEDYEDNEDMP